MSVYASVDDWKQAAAYYGGPLLRDCLRAGSGSGLGVPFPFVFLHSIIPPLVSCYLVCVGMYIAFERARISPLSFLLSLMFLAWAGT